MKALLFILSLLLPCILIAQPAQWYSRGIGGGGALFAPTISPNDPSNMYLQCDMSEVFHTNNQGGLWSQVHFTELISSGGQHTVEYTSNPSILYSVNTDYITDERYPVKSSDFGIHWSPTELDPTNGDVWYISADPNSTLRLLVASYEELFYSSDGGASFSSVYSTGGFHIAGVFWDGNSIFVGTREGLLVSTNNGDSFTLDNTQGIPSNYGFISFTGSKTGNQVRLMGTTADEDDLYPGINALDIGICTGIYKMDYGVSSWQSTTNGINGDHEVFLISSSMIDINTFYTAGTNTNNSFPVVYKTSDGGNSWSEVFLTNNNQNIATGWSGYQGDENWWYGEIVFGLDVAPNDPNTVIITDFGFAHVTSNGGNSWKQAYVEMQDQNPSGSPTPVDKAYAGNGLENTSCWNMLWVDNSTIFSSYTDITAIRSADGGAKWKIDYNGIDYNTVYHVVRASNGTLYAAVSSVHDLYQSTYLTDNRIDAGDGAILYSTDNGANWQMLHNFSMPVIWLALDPTNPEELYASVVNSQSGGIYRTANLGSGDASTWSITTSPARTEGHPYTVYVLNDGTIVSSWSGRRASNFTPSSGVFVSTNDGVSWEDVSLEDKMYYWTKDLVIDPNDASQNTWYVAVHSGWGGEANDKGGLYKTTDRGQNWTLVFDSYRVESAGIHPQNPAIVYATTESEGLWYSENATEANPTFSQLMNYDFQHPMRVFFHPQNANEVWVTSFGNGMKTGNTEVSGLATLKNGPEFMIFPNPANNYFSLKTASNARSFSVADQQGNIVLTGEMKQQTMVDTHSLVPGMYFISVNYDTGETATEKIIILPKH
jgi:photosystem II stability/assembly factor-like uncharacterized protein